MLGTLFSGLHGDAPDRAPGSTGAASIPFSPCSNLVIEGQFCSASIGRGSFHAIDRDPWPCAHTEPLGGLLAH